MAVCIIFSKAQGVVRRIIVEDNPDKVDMKNHFVAYGEDYLLLNPVNPITGAEAQEMVNILRAKPHTSDRCCVVDENDKVVEIALADPEIDKHPKGKLVLHPHAQIGWTHKDGDLAP